MASHTGSKLWIVLAIDILLVNTALVVAAFLRFRGLPPEQNLEALITVLPWGSLVAAVILFSLGLYEQPWNLRARLGRTIVIATILTGLAYAAISYWARGFAVPRSVLLMAMPLTLLLLLAWRMVLMHFAMRSNGGRTVLVVGHPGEAAEVAQRFAEIPGGWFRVIGTRTPEIAARADFSLDGVDVLMLCQSVQRPQKETLLHRSADKGITTFVIPDLTEIMLSGQVPNAVADLPVLVYEPFGLTPGQRFEKRLLDLLVGVPAFVLSLPLMSVITLLIKLSGPGPAILRQERLGLNGQIFRMYKFRTMTHNAEAESGPALVWDDDPRITGLGSVLRRFRLDEIPQIINVLKGDMSLVGPRPERPELAQAIVQEVPNFKYRVMVPPGMTGLAQVMGLYSTRPVDKVRFDLFYMRNYSLWLDLSIMFRTLVVLLDRNAARGISTERAEGTVNPRTTD
jgi:exopolysaccharide biosynthesis polyprenyl glycosylphosphotransferase